jgi:hypothetical protein
VLSVEAEASLACRPSIEGGAVAPGDTISCVAATHGVAAAISS